MSSKSPFINTRLLLEQIQLTRADERLGAAPHVELAVDVVDMLLDRADGDDERIRDLLVGAPRPDRNAICGGASARPAALAARSSAAWRLSCSVGSSLTSGVLVP